VPTRGSDDDVISKRLSATFFIHSYMSKAFHFVVFGNAVAAAAATAAVAAEIPRCRERKQ